MAAQIRPTSRLQDIEQKFVVSPQVGKLVEATSLQVVAANEGVIYDVGQDEKPSERRRDPAAWPDNSAMKAAAWLRLEALTQSAAE